MWLILGVLLFFLALYLGRIGGKHIEAANSHYDNNEKKLGDFHLFLGIIYSSPQVLVGGAVLYFIYKLYFG